MKEVKKVLRVTMTNNKEFVIDKDFDEFQKDIYDLKGFKKRATLKNSIIKISDITSINPNQISMIEEVERIYNMSRQCYQIRQIQK